MLGPQLPPISVPVRLAAAGIVVLGAVLRLWGNDAASPFRMGVDEPVIVSTALRMIRTGDFHPHFFDYGGLTLYLHAAVGTLAFMSGAMDGRWSNLSMIWEGDLLAGGRTFTALLGTLTVLLVYWIGLRWGRTVALASALAMAILPAHVREAHFILTDTPLTLFITLTLLLSLKAVESQRLSSVALAGLAVGLAAAIKYNGAAALVMPLMAALALPRGQRAGGMCAAAAASGVTFLLCAPYTFLALPDFLNRFAALMQAYNRDRPMIEGLSNYLAHVRNWFTWPGVLLPQFGYLALGVALLGWGTVIVRTRDRQQRLRAALLVVFPVMYFWFISSQALQYGRYLLPIGPMLCIGLAVGTATAVQWCVGRMPAAARFALPIALLVLLAPPTASTLAWLRTNGRTSTAEQAAGWLVAQGPNADRVVVDEAVAIHLPPPLVTARTRDLVGRSIDDYRRDNVTYLITTSAQTDRYYADPATFRAQLTAHQTMMALATPVATFTPSREHPGPTITVLRIKP